MKLLFAFLMCGLSTSAFASGLSDYTTTAGNNTFLFPEPMPAGDVNDAARQVMADVRAWYEAPQWIDLGFDPTRQSNTTFTVVGDKTVYFTVGRRVRMTDTGTLYGTIASSAYSAPNTTVTVTMDSGSMTSNLIAVAVGFADGQSSPIPGSALSGITVDRITSGTTNVQATSATGIISLTTGGENIAWATSKTLVISGTLNLAGIASVRGVSSSGAVTATTASLDSIMVSGGVSASNITATTINVGSILVNGKTPNPQAIAKIGGFGTCTVQTGSFNIATCVRISTGRYGVSYTNPVINSIPVCMGTATGSTSVYANTDAVISPTTTGFVVDTFNPSNANDSAAIYCNVSGS